MGITINISDGAATLAPAQLAPDAGPRSGSAPAREGESVSLDAGAATASGPAIGAPMGHPDTREGAFDGGAPAAGLLQQIEMALGSTRALTRDDYSSAAGGISGGGAPV